MAQSGRTRTERRIFSDDNSTWHIPLPSQKIPPSSGPDFRASEGDVLRETNHFLTSIGGRVTGESLTETLIGEVSGLV